MKITNFISIILIFSEIKQIININCFEFSCEECNDSNYGSCIRCKENFNLIDGTCPCYDSNCALCDSSYPNSNCYFCKNNLINYFNRCLCLINNCEICGNNICLKCRYGYKYNSNENICEIDNSDLKCFDENCVSCSYNEEGFCDLCKNGFYLNQGRCFELEKCILDENNENCVSCLDNQNYYLKEDGFCYEKCYGQKCSDVQLDNQFYNCEDNCLVCKNYDLYFITNCKDKEQCVIENCALCRNSNDCFYCLSGFFKQNGLCYKCPNNCLKCSTSNICLACNVGYKLNDNGKCDLIVDGEEGSLEHQEFVELNDYLNRYGEIKERFI